MKNNITTIQKNAVNHSSETGGPTRPDPNVNKSWKIKLMKKGLITLQHISPKKTSEIIWQQFTKPGKPRELTPPQSSLMQKAQVSYFDYLGNKVAHYKWGDGDKKVLLCHGWGSKVADFRKLIDSLLHHGYTIEGIDMKAHGQSEGTRTAAPEFRDILKNHYVKNGPYHAVIGYSLGGLTAGLMLSEITETIHPKHLILISSPPYVRYFFHDIIKQFGFKDEVYEEMCHLVEKYYHQEIDYFDLRNKQEQLRKIAVHLIYDRDDETVPFDRGAELNAALSFSQFTQTSGLGHYKILSSPDVIERVGFILKNQ